MAFVEVAAGLALALAPGFSVQLLLGTSLDSPAALVITRMTGIALCSLGIACWLAHKDGQSRAGMGLIGSMLFYNIAVASLFIYSGLTLSIAGVLLWPAVLLHTVLAMGCLSCLRRSPAQAIRQ